MTVMSASSMEPMVREGLVRARQQIAEAQVISAELELRALVARHAGCVDAWLLLAELAQQRGDYERERECLEAASAAAPGDGGLALNKAEQQLRAGNLADAVELLCALLQRSPKHVLAWMTLGQALDLAGRKYLAVRAWSQGLHHGQAAGQLMGMDSTPPSLRPVIQRIIAEVNEHQYAPVVQGLDRMRSQFGASEIKRLEHAIAGYLGAESIAPQSPHQAPKFLYFPGLPQGPYHDPYQHPWAGRLDDAFDDIRAEALQELQREAGLEDFLVFEPGQSMDGYLGGAGSKPSWDAFFFYRHGKRYDANHERCPKTAAVLRSIELCEVEGQAPEICFSVLQPGTHIMPHHGVTNTRLVMHLPLLVPPDCALNVMGGGEHAWRERELMMFDDTFRHEAWNRSDQPRVILLMDCWNPHLSPAERVATRDLVELISKAENFPAEELMQVARAIREE
jgi:aspartate beta-hydroxylase